jgi:hypothetical protein
MTAFMTAIGLFRSNVPLRASDTEGYRGVRGTSGRTRNIGYTPCFC